MLGNYDEAIKAWELSLEHNSSRSDAHVNLANIYTLIKKDYPNAIYHYEHAIRISPNDGEIYYNCGLVLDAAGKLEDAIRAFQRALELDIESAAKPLRNAMAKWIGQEADKANVQ